jgi:hypothetical protein
VNHRLAELARLHSACDVVKQVLHEARDAELVGDDAAVAPHPEHDDDVDGGDGDAKKTDLGDERPRHGQQQRHEHHRHLRSDAIAHVVDNNAQ